MYRWVLTTTVCSPSSDLVREELLVGRLRRRPESSWEAAAVWVNKTHHSLDSAFFSPAFRLVSEARGGERADIIGHEGVGRMTHDA